MNLRTYQGASGERTDADAGSFTDGSGNHDDDDTVDLVRSLLDAHGLGFSGPLRDLIAGDPDATRRAVVLHLGGPVHRGARPGLGVPAGAGLPSGPAAARGCPGCAVAEAVTGGRFSVCYRHFYAEHRAGLL